MIGFLHASPHLKLFGIALATVVAAIGMLLLVSAEPTAQNLGHVTINQTSYQVEVAATPEKIQQGLSGREEIGADGMLFVLPEKVTPQFWMKEMRFALDFVWIADQQVVDITENVPAPDPDTPLFELPRYAPQQPVNYVLELPAGQVAADGIAVGDSVTFSLVEKSR